MQEGCEADLEGDEKVIDREKVIKALECLKEGSYCECCDYKPYDDCIKRVATDAIALLKKQETQKFFVDESGKITPLPVVVRCKDCVHRGKAEKCVLAAISEEKDFPLFMLDNRGEWFCADGVAKDINVPDKEGW